jgi:hypothetical protein
MISMRRREKRGRAGCAAPAPGGEIDKADKCAACSNFPATAQAITADFTGTPPGACHRCRREFAATETVWGGWTADGFARLGNCCSASLEIVVIVEIRRRPQ